MDHPTLDERLPALYREILEAASELEHRGLRRQALRIRRRATREYQTWDERAERRLRAVLAEALRLGRPTAPRDGVLVRLRLRARPAPGSGSVVQPTA